MENQETKKRGRPKGWRKENPRSIRLPQVLVTLGEVETYKAAAKAKGLTFSAWVRGALDKDSGYTGADQSDKTQA